MLVARISRGLPNLLIAAVSGLTASLAEVMGHLVLSLSSLSVSLNFWVFPFSPLAFLPLPRWQSFLLGQASCIVNLVVCGGS